MPLRRIDFCPVWIGVLVLALFCGAVPGRSASISTTFNVTATVQASCGVTAADLDFGAYMPGSDAANDTTIDVTCTNGTAYTIALDGGSVAHDVTARQMSDSGSNRLSYELYTDSSFATVWGDGTLATATISGTGNGAAQPATVYGRVPAGQYVPATNYADQITVKVTYWRDGASHDVDVKLGKLPTDDQLASNQDDGSGSQAEPTSSLSDFGLALGPSDDHKGVVVTDVDPNGQAAERGLQPGDVILSVGDTAVKAPAEIEKKVADAKAGGSKAVLLRVQSGDQTRFVALSFAHT